jgi:hypothetical protein
VRQRTHRSRDSSYSMVWELAGGCGKWRVEHGGPISGLTKARAAVWWPGDSDEVVAEEKLGGDSAQALGEGEKRGSGMVRTGGGVSLL